MAITCEIIFALHLDLDIVSPTDRQKCYIRIAHERKVSRTSIEGICRLGCTVRYYCTIRGGYHSHEVC